MIKKGDIINLHIDSLAYGGRGVARLDNYVIFVDKALPGQDVSALVYKKKKGFGEARILEIRKESQYNTNPLCEHFSFCGGCGQQHLKYSEQLKQKKKQVEDIFSRQAGIDSFCFNTVVPAEEHFYYRNKMEFTFSSRRWLLPDEKNGTPSDFALGLHIPRRWDKILDINECHIQHQFGNKLIEFVKKESKELGLKPYNQKTHNGYLRHLVLRFGINTNQTMVNFVTAYDHHDLLTPLVNRLISKFPMLTSIVNNINRKKGDTAYGEWENLLHGTSYIEEKIGDLTFEISSNSFFQTNTHQAEKLYSKIKEKANLTGKEIVFDLYCGTGTIALFLANQAKKIVGFETVSHAVEDAHRNAVRNGIGNVQFIQKNLEKRIQDSSLPVPDVVVVDPPRAGMLGSAIQSLLSLGSKKIIYVSCNPSTQARDSTALIQGGYFLKSLSMVDMFPHTPHIETIGEFELKK
jgi:23S rRNA (uracil1939-C5)-methyltransferase